MLALNDEALEAVAGQRLAGYVRLGMQEDFGEALLPEVPGRFARAHPDVHISARIVRNKALCRDIENGQLDLALCWHDAHAMPDAPVRRYLGQKEPLPLVLFEAPCLMRQRALAALDDAGIPWRIVFTSRSLGGIWAAVNVGLGVTVRTIMGMPAALAIDTAQVLPELPPLGISLLQSEARLPEETARLKMLVSWVMQWQIAGSL